MSSYLTNLAEQAGAVDAERLPYLGEEATAPLQGAAHTASAEMLTELMEQHDFTKDDPSMEFKGSADNVEFVRKSIYEKYGADDALAYEPCVHVRPKTEWLKNGYIILDSEPLCQIITYRRGQQYAVDMWHINQVEEG